jgi:DNA transformation protein and related proteins
MPKPSPFVEHVAETMRLFGPVDTRRMFGGWGIYHQGVFFALVADDVVYLKTDEQNRAEFDARGLEPFAFEKKGERIETHYRAAPEEALEDPAEMVRWARLAYAAALRAASAKARKAPSRPRPPAAKRRS